MSGNGIWTGLRQATAWRVPREYEIAPYSIDLQLRSNISTYPAYWNWYRNRYDPHAHCVVLWRGFGWQWADYPCDYTAEYVCAFDLGYKCSCGSDYCSGKGTCRVDNGINVCTCNPGWTGSTCELCALDAESGKWCECDTTGWMRSSPPLGECNICAPGWGPAPLASDSCTVFDTCQYGGDTNAEWQCLETDICTPVGSGTTIPHPVFLPSYDLVLRRRTPYAIGLKSMPATLTWESAKARCFELGGWLFTPENSEEEAVLRQHVCSHRGYTPL